MVYALGHYRFRRLVVEGLEVFRKCHMQILLTLNKKAITCVTGHYDILYGNFALTKLCL